MNGAKLQQSLFYCSFFGDLHIEMCCSRILLLKVTSDSVFFFNVREWPLINQSHSIHYPPFPQVK